MITNSVSIFFIVFILLVYMYHKVVILRFCDKMFYKENKKKKKRSDETISMVKILNRSWVDTKSLPHTSNFPETEVPSNWSILLLLACF